ncbi:MAG: phosphoenolpyruvate--protein phosphotransferase [Deltaproteobacteria bacterium]|nr:MAG: phosphoenolpyruvate--protein phosphotransferase [Deltaproteobacteria bacterium]
MKNKTQSTNEGKILKGIGVSPGIVIGKAVILERQRTRFVPRRITAREVGSEVRRFREAIIKSKRELQEIKERILEKGFKQHSYILDVHIKLMEDRMLRDETIKMIKEQLVNTEWALEVTLDKISEAFDSIEDDYLRERKEDIKHVVDRILRNLTGRELRKIEDLEEEMIVVAHDLSPADTIQLNLKRVIGFATDMGGKTSHTAIVARSLEIPAVVGLEDVTAYVGGGETIIIDGTEGVVIVEPSQATVKAFRLRQQHYRYLERELLKYSSLKAETQDGYHLALEANIELVDEIPSVIQYGAEGIGLYRTEYLYLSRRTLPTEDEHFQVYKKLAEEIAPYSVTIRTLDLGGDKFASHIELAEEMNPAMGLRAIRFCIKEKEIFKTQLRGILRASIYGNLKILLPMISGVEELRQVKAILEETKEELMARGVPFDPNIPLGVMIEIPSAAVTADILAREVDFLSIGTNDLIQYSLAIDRVNEHVSYLYEPLHPAILRSIKGVVNVAHKAGIEVGICGEMAADPLYTLIFLGMELDELSMNAIAIPRVKKVLRRATIAEGERLLKEILQFSTAKETEQYIRKEMAKLFPEDFIQCIE